MPPQTSFPRSLSCSHARWQVPVAVINLVVDKKSCDINVTPDKRSVMLHGDSSTPPSSSSQPHFAVSGGTPQS